MKNLKQFIEAIIVLTFFAACDKEDNEPKVYLDKATISARWIVSNSNDYDSFEFNESGNYIVVKHATPKSALEQIILFGTYEIKDNKTIVLSDFGSLNISEINENTISFTIKLTNNPGNGIIIHASKKEEMESSARTDLLCRTWEMVTSNGEYVIGTENEVIVLFSKAGTYFVFYVNNEVENEESLAQWKWKDETETQLLYSWDEVPVWIEEDYVEIPELTSTTLKIIEDAETYIFQPVNNIKSGMVKSSKNSSKKLLKSGFLKK